MVHPLFLKFAIRILMEQFGITERLAKERLLEAAQALDGEQADIKAVLALAIDLQEARCS